MLLYSTEPAGEFENSSLYTVIAYRVQPTDSTLTMVDGLVVLDEVVGRGGVQATYVEL
jgi:hypothetical protein